MWDTGPRWKPGSETRQPRRNRTTYYKRVLLLFVLSVLSVLAFAEIPVAGAAELWIGVATTNITPDRPVALDGQFGLRISQGVDNPVMATAVAVEARPGGRAVDQAILVSCDLVAIRPAVLSQTRANGCGAARLRPSQADSHRDAHPHRTGDGGRDICHSFTGCDAAVGVRGLPRGSAGRGGDRRLEAAPAGRRCLGGWGTRSSGIICGAVYADGKARCTVPTSPG